MKKRKRLLDTRLLAFRAAFFTLFLALLALAATVTRHTRWFLLILLIASTAAVLLVLELLLLWKPYFEETKRLGLATSTPELTDLPSSKYYYNKQCRYLAERLNAILKTSNSFELSKRQAQYQALQNQINPHFLYNTLESIRSEALISGLGSVADMCEALANFFRYTISNQADVVTVDEELQNIKTYFYIQQYRFGSRLTLKIEYEEDDVDTLIRCKLPKLTLQPIVENAIIHGIEQKLGNGTVTIKLMMTQRCLLIRISDDGVGMDPEILEKVNQRMAGNAPPGSGKGGIAIANVNNRIRLLFGETYGVIVYSTLGVGTDVEISLPRAI
ncbi:putative two-component histidine kinase [Oscillibacter valericigenes Sjm18-20]|nr:putative two-component histidine kinase [Oscillibacter valericigenes Sjm18-20]